MKEFPTPVVEMDRSILPHTRTLDQLASKKSSPASVFRLGRKATTAILINLPKTCWYPESKKMYFGRLKRSIIVGLFG